MDEVNENVILFLYSQLYPRYQEFEERDFVSLYEGVMQSYMKRPAITREPEFILKLIYVSG